MRRSGRVLSGLGVLGTVALAACANDFDTTRVPPPRGTLGEEMFGVLCDRVGGQALHEDLTGASFRGVCHKDFTGKYADKVDQTLLPALSADAVDTAGNPVSMDKQQATRSYAVARVEALARRRGDLVGALDATFPDIMVSVKDVKNSNGAKSCTPVGQQARLHDELSDMLGRFQQLYNDGTLPQSTESLAKLMQAFKASKESQQALARFDSRKGYRPVDVALGAARPIIAYPGLRDLSNATLALLSADSQPYAPNPKLDGNGNRIPVPGAANAQFNKSLEVMTQEFLGAKADPVLPPLVVTKDAPLGRDVLSRTRDNLEVMQELLYAPDKDFGGGDSRFIVKRDGRGYAQVALASGAVPAPFTDADGDHLADVDDLGQFITTGDGAPTPFFTVTSSVTATRDPFGRALFAPNQPMYDYIDTSHTFAASLMSDMKALVNPDPAQNHETLMYALSGARVIFGTRDGSPATTRTYDGGGSVQYDAFHPESAPMLDLVYAIGQVLADKNTDGVLSYTKTLFQNQTPALARLVGNGLAVKDLGNKHTEAKIPLDSTLWDDVLDVVAKIAHEPGLLEDLLLALGEDDSLALGGIFSSYMKNDDHISYDQSSLNGPVRNLTTKDPSDPKTPVDRTKPDTGWNQSNMQRFSRAIHDAIGVTACNKDNAVVHAKGIPVVGSLNMPIGGGTYKECEVFKIENLGKFYLDAIVGKASLYFRPDLLRNGACILPGVCFGAATVDVIEQSSGIGLNANDTTGFWDPPSANSFRPRPQWLNRLVFFDLDSDKTNSTTSSFLTDLQGKFTIGTLACPERIIDDPVPAAPDASPDGKVHGLRSCPPGQSLFERDQDALFPWEMMGFFKAMQPLLKAFVKHNQEDLFLGLLDALHKHWGDDKMTAAECDLGSGASCTKDGAFTYEPFLSEAMVTDLLPALHDMVNILQVTTVKTCSALDATTKQCTASADTNGIAIIANATRALVDPAISKANGIQDRTGKTTALRNDGTTNPQVTPVYLLTNALHAIDKSFDDYANTHPDDNARLAQWRTARSQLVDQFLAAQGNGNSASFRNKAFPKITPVLIDVLRAQLFAHCPTSFTPPYDKCAWAQTEMTQKLSDIVAGPLFASTMDLTDAIRKDDAARTQLETLLNYLLDSASNNDALASMLASSSDMIQVLRDDTNLVPLFHVLSAATAAGSGGQKSLVDAQTALLSRISGRAFDGNQEQCNKELDPNQILTVALGNLVTPMKQADGTMGQTPLQVIMDVVGDVNRLLPDKTDKFVPDDYASVTDQVTDFLLNKERGLEQFYEIMRQGTVR
jgi:hypothetical protein